MNDDEMRTLYGKLFVEKSYDGDSPPTDRVLIDFVRGTLPPHESERVASYLQSCSAALDDARDIDEHRQWLQANRADVWARLLERATALGVDPAIGEVHDLELLFYVAGRLPRTAAGELARQRIAAALAHDPAVQAQFESLQRERPAVTQLIDVHLQPKSDRTVQTHVLTLVAGLQALALLWQRARQAEPATYRHAANPTILATQFDGTGHVRLDARGQPSLVEFDVVAASIDALGRCCIDLSTKHNAVWESAQSKFSALVSVECAGVALQFRPERISREGRVIVVDQLGAGAIVREIPAAAIQVQITPEEKG